MSELWYVTARDDAGHDLYTVLLSVEEISAAVCGAAAALQTASDRLLFNGYDPRQVSNWQVVRHTAPEARG